MVSRVPTPSTRRADTWMHVLFPSQMLPSWSWLVIETIVRKFAYANLANTMAVAATKGPQTKQRSYDAKKLNFRLGEPRRPRVSVLIGLVHANTWITITASFSFGFSLLHLLSLSLPHLVPVSCSPLRNNHSIDKVILWRQSLLLIARNDSSCWPHKSFSLMLLTLASCQSRE